jgi:tetraacyldisaccharide 4'-kinase
VGKDRAEVGRLLEAQLRPEWMLLDDGFQHVGLDRDLDIVLLDAENPWGGGLFPLGFRREPIQALARAEVIVLTRVPRGARMTGLERMVRRYNPSAPIFRSRMVPEPWMSPGGTVGAFCGIGSPPAFWRTLDELGLKVVWREAFRDHHAYTAAELERVSREAQAAGAGVLVTTEKDMMNLPEGLRLTLPVECVRIGVEIEDEPALLKLIQRAIGGRTA